MSNIGYLIWVCTLMNFLVLGMIFSKLCGVSMLWISVIMILGYIIVVWGPIIAEKIWEGGK